MYCLLAFKSGTEFHHVTDNTLQKFEFKVKGQSHRVEGQSQHKVMYQQQKRYNIAMDRFSDFKLGMAL